MSSELDLTQLRQVAQQATPGPWEEADSEGWIGGPGCFVVSPDETSMSDDGPLRLSFNRATDATHIATFDPPTVLALLDRVEAAEQALAAYQTRDALSVPVDLDALERAAKAEAAVQRVRAKHAKRVLVYPNGAEEHYCAAEENSAWPCDTIRALDGGEQE